MAIEYIESAELSDLGKKRKNNEDALLRIPDKGIYCVADGMGGAVGGDLASDAIVTSVREVFGKASSDDCSNLEGLIALFEKAANQANNWIRNFAEEKAINGMGSTIVALILDPRNPARAIGLHAGDSRLYRFREGTLECLTIDHTAAAAIATALGQTEKSLPARYQNELVRAVGLSERVELERIPVNLRSGDLFFLCSDGLTHMVSDRAIAELLKQHSQEASAVITKALVDAANQAGGNDNITVVLLKVGKIIDSLFDPEPVVEADSPATMATACPTDGNPHFSAVKPSDDRVTPNTPDTCDVNTPESDDIAAQEVDPPPHHDESQGREVEEERRATSGRRGPWLAICALAAVVVASVGVFSYRSAQSKHDRQAPLTTTASSTNGGINTATLISVMVSSDLQHAEVLADGTNLWGHTPLLTNLLVGSYPLMVRYPDLGDRQLTLMLRKGQMATNVVVRFARGSVRLTSEPAGAQVFVNGVLVGTTPYENLVVNPGKPFACELNAGPLHAKLTLQVSENEMLRTNVVLSTGQGVLVLSSDPPGAEIFWNGRSLGQTSVTGLHTQPIDKGLQTLVAQHPVFGEQQMTVVVRADAEVVTNVVFASGTVLVRSDPEGAEVLRQGSILGRTPYSARLAVGRQELTVRYPGLGEQTVMVEAWRDQTVTNAIVRIPHGVIDLTSEPSGAQVWVDGIATTSTTPYKNLVVAPGHAVRYELKKGELKQTLTLLAMDSQTVKTNVVLSGGAEIISPSAGIYSSGKPITNAIGMEFAWVEGLPGGSCWVGKYTVTQAQYQQIMGVNPSAFSGDGRLPVTMVNFYDAIQFCDKLNERESRKGIHYQLLTRAQWMELGKDVKLEDSVTSLQGQVRRTHPEPVGSTGKPNKFGLFDLRGNVWQWCETAKGDKHLCGGGFKGITPSFLPDIDARNEEWGFRCIAICTNGQ